MRTSKNYKSLCGLLAETSHCILSSTMHTRIRHIQMCIDYTSIAYNILSYTEYCLFLEKVRKEETKRREMFELEIEKQTMKEAE